MLLIRFLAVDENAAFAKISINTFAFHGGEIKYKSKPHNKDVKNGIYHCYVKHVKVIVRLTGMSWLIKSTTIYHIFNILIPRSLSKKSLFRC